MHLNHQISITSQTAVGGSSLFKALKEKLADFPYRWVSAGGLMRQRAEELGMNINEFSRYNCLHPEAGHDRWCDNTIAEMAESDWMVCESRLSHIFMPEAFKVLLVCDLRTRAERRQKDYPDKSVSEILREIEERDRNDALRYEALYPGCMWRSEKFNFLIDTRRLSPDTAADCLLYERERWIQRLARNSCLGSALRWTHQYAPLTS